MHKIQLKLAVFLCIFSALNYQCDLWNNEDEEEEEEDLIEKSEELLTAHKWKKTKVHYLRAATDTYPEPLDETVLMQDMDECLLDNYWLFDMEYKYQKNNGTIKCLPDEETVGDWGDWYFDDSYQNSSYLVLSTSGWNPALPDADYEYEVLELSAYKLKIRRGGCSDNTKPDEDGICITMTYVPY